MLSKKCAEGLKFDYTRYKYLLIRKNAVSEESLAPSTCGKRNESDLRGADHRLAFAIAPADHHLLREEHLLRGDLDAEVSTRHHDAVGLVDDLIEAAHGIR